MNELNYEMPFDYQLLVGDLPLRIPDATSAEIPAKAHVRIRIRMSDDPDKAPPSKRMRDDANRFDLVGLSSIAQDKDGDDDTTDAAAAAAAAAALAAADDKADDSDLAEGETRYAAASAAAARELSPKAPCPEYSTWFSLRNVNDIERRALPDFFSGKNPSKIEKLYREIRRFPVISWRRVPDRYLSATAARHHLRYPPRSQLSHPLRPY
jgi:SWI/SNF related-matrix-associated actin-dependent regulator of chromatin subfamily C